MLFFCGHFLLIFTGFLLSVMGGGGSILSLPILIYCFQLPPHLAASYSLLIVSFSSLFALLGKVKERDFSLSIAFYLGIPATLGTYLIRRFSEELIPPVLFGVISGENLLKILFILTLFVVAFLMLRAPSYTSQKKPRPLMMVGAGFLIGLYTGFLGIGGGFILIPTFVYLGGIDIKKAVATSLLIIMVKSSLGVLGDLHTATSFKLSLVLSSLGACAGGTLLGIFFTKKISKEQLKGLFSYFILLLALTLSIVELRALSA